MYTFFAWTFTLMAGITGTGMVITGSESQFGYYACGLLMLNAIFWSLWKIIEVLEKKR